jgi:hypothetical protein
VQNKYVGDVGDFGKYGLLRALCQPQDGYPPLKLGVIWYLVPDESHNNDGKHTAYLQPTPQNHQRFRECDPELYDTLQQLVNTGQRRVEAVERSNILGPHTAFYSRPLTYEGLRTRSERLAFREAWLAEALEAVKDCDLVFIDPDNGLPPKAGPYEQRGIKYVFQEELARIAARGQSLVIYHHLGRQTKAVSQIRQLCEEVGPNLRRNAPVWGLRFHRGTARIFLVTPASTQQELLAASIHEFCTKPWGAHFELFGRKC